MYFSLSKAKVDVKVGILVPAGRMVTACTGPFTGAGVLCREKRVGGQDPEAGPEEDETTEQRSTQHTGDIPDMEQPGSPQVTWLPGLGQDSAREPAPEPCKLTSLPCQRTCGHKTDTAHRLN